MFSSFFFLEVEVEFFFSPFPLLSLFSKKAPKLSPSATHR